MSYLSGTNIYLRAIEPEDLDILYQWENDSFLWVHGCTLAPFSKFTLREYIQNSCYDIYQTRQLRMMITLKKTNETIGMVDLFEIDPHHERGAVGILIAPDHQRKGFGNEALQLMCSYAFGFLHLHQLYAHILQENKNSLKLFSENGFISCGLFKEWVKTENGYKNVVVMQRIN